MAIEVRDLRVRYGKTEAVRGVTFQVARGEVCGYLGPNGAGKSSTVKAIAGILTPESGNVCISGFDMRGQKLKAQRRLGYAPEDAAAFTLLTGSEYLELVADLYELPEDGLAARRGALLDRLDLGKIAPRPIATYSKGQRQKLCIAAALLHDPEVLILDEPLSGLDAHAVRTVKDIISERAAAGAAVLFVSHMLEVVERVCSRVVILSQGAIVADRATADLVAAAKDRTLESVFLELTGKGRTAEAAALAEALATPGRPR